MYGSIVMIFLLGVGVLYIVKNNKVSLRENKIISENSNELSKNSNELSDNGNELSENSNESSDNVELTSFDGKDDNINDRKDNSAKNENKTSNSNSDIDKARDVLYKTMGISKNDVDLGYIKDDLFSKYDPRMKDKYYAFDYTNRNTGNMGDVVFLVDKKDFSIYEWPVLGTIIPHELTKDINSPAYKYLVGFYYPPNDENKDSVAVKYFEKYGAKAFANKIQEIFKEADKRTLSYYKDNYVNLILAGSTKKELDSHVKRSLEGNTVLYQGDYEKVK